MGQGKDTPYQGKAAFAHLGLNSIILLETVKEQSQSPPPGMQLRCSVSSSPAARFQTRCTPVSLVSAELSHCTTRQSRVLPLCKHFTLKEEDLYKTSANFRVLLSEVLSQYQCLYRRLLQRELISLNPYLWVNTCVQADNDLGFDQISVNTM